MPQKKILFIDTAHPGLQQMLEQMGFVCDYFPAFQKNDYLSVAAEYAGFVVRSKIPINKELIDAAVKLRFIARVGAGMENIDAAYALHKGIHCMNAPEGNRDAVAEHALGMLLALFNKLLRADKQVRRGIWLREENRGIELGGKTIGIIGYGNTGSALAQKLSGFNVKVLAFDKYKSGFSDDFAEEADMDRIYAQADILSLHVPLTNETNYLVDRAYLEKFSKSIFFINTSRGKVVQTNDLVVALQDGKVLGACLDVLEFEKSSFESLQLSQFPETMKQLFALENIVLSPHIAGWTNESNAKMAKVLAEKIKALSESGLYSNH
jgi:D-3-phosphoglycerate dehydrogenase / 2-oxoglutarate reductase